MYVQSFLIKYILLLQIPVFTRWSSSPFSDPIILSKIIITGRFINKLYYITNLNLKKPQSIIITGRFISKLYYITNLNLKKPQHKPNL